MPQGLCTCTQPIKLIPEENDGQQENLQSDVASSQDEYF
jgi:hypothetical protein